MGYSWHMFLQKYWYKVKIRQKNEHLLLKIGFIKPSFVRTLTTFGLRCRIISVKLLVFGVNIKLDTNTEILIITKL